MSGRDDDAKQALSEEGAMCGNCGDEPGDRNCPDCEHCLGWYVDALRKIGWAPRAATLREAADLLRDLHFGKGYSVQEIGTALRHMADEAATRAEVLRETEVEALAALRLIHEDMITARNSGDEWASEWLNDLWVRLPLKLRAIVGDDEALSELAAEGGDR